jgi:L-ascorbate metabolism protein UlaG (beta-lactamase superfamily)
MDLASIPRPDLILLSHAHFDHLDLPSLRALQHKKTTVITASKTGDLLEGKRFAAVHELGWGESQQVGPMHVRAFQVRHWGARMRTDTYRGFNGYTIEVNGSRIIFGGDTALTNTFQNLKSSRPWDLAIMPIGAYDPWIYAHCTPEEAWKMAGEAGAEHVLPVHHQTFALSREPLLDPIMRLREVAGSAQDRIAVTELGGEFRI